MKISLFRLTQTSRTLPNPEQQQQQTLEFISNWKIIWQKNGIHEWSLDSVNKLKKHQQQLPISTSIDAENTHRTSFDALVKMMHAAAENQAFSVCQNTRHMHAYIFFLFFILLEMFV